MTLDMVVKLLVVRIVCVQQVIVQHLDEFLLMNESPNIAIFTITDRTDHFLLCICTWG